VLWKVALSLNKTNLKNIQLQFNITCAHLQNSNLCWKSLSVNFCVKVTWKGSKLWVILWFVDFGIPNSLSICLVDTSGLMAIIPNTASAVGSLSGTTFLSFLTLKLLLMKLMLIETQYKPGNHTMIWMSSMKKSITIQYRWLSIIIMAFSKTRIISTISFEI